MKILLNLLIGTLFLRLHAEGASYAVVPNHYFGFAFLGLACLQALRWGRS